MVTESIKKWCEIFQFSIDRGRGILGKLRDFTLKFKDVFFVDNHHFVLSVLIYTTKTRVGFKITWIEFGTSKSTCHIAPAVKFPIFH